MFGTSIANKPNNDETSHDTSALTPNQEPIDISPENWLVNLTDCSIPTNVKQFLSLGHNFAIDESLKSFSPQIFISEFEKGLQCLPRDKYKEQIDSFRSAFVNIMLNHAHYLRGKKPDPTANVIKRFLKDNKDLLVTRADKGQVTVLLDRNAYLTAGLDLLNDQSTYTKLQKDKNVTAQNLNNKLVKLWNQKKYISDDLQKHLTTNTSTCPRLYILPKIHKPNLSYRPIVSSINGPLHKLGRFIHTKLLPLTSDHFSSTKNSLHFKQSTESIIIPDGYTLISLDVTSLFTNVPIELVKNAINNRKNKLSGNIPSSEIIKAVEIIMTNTYFQFNNSHYKQHWGLPMGSPLAPVCADLAMQDLETHCLNQLNFTIPFFHRYVDDILTCVPTDKIQLVIDTFNAYHPRLNFTHEIESDGKIPFLDLLVIRKGNNLIYDWYRKPTFSGRLLNFHSHHPMHQKIAIILNLVDRVYNLSDKQFFNGNLLFAKHILRINGYPSDFVNHHIKRRLEMLRTNSISNPATDDGKSREVERKNSLIFPFSERLSMKLGRLLKKFDNKLISKIDNKLNRVFGSTKDKLDSNQKSHLIYQINCLNCNKIYIGQTGRYLRERLNQHKYCVERISTNGRTALTKHAQTHKHSFDFDKTKILDIETNKYKRNFIEMYHIKKRIDNCVNFRTDINKLTTSYNHLISDY